MAPRPSTIPAFKAALIAALEAGSWPSPAPQVCYGDPATRSRSDVIVGDTAQEGNDEQQWASLGARQRDERYALNLIVDVTVPGKTCQQAVELGFAYFAVVEDVVRSNPTMGIQGVTVAELRQPVHIESGTDEGWVVSIESAVRVEARI